jgi:hypothetical protein
MSARRRTTRPEDDDPREEDVEAFSGVTRTCPNCRSEVYDEAELCWNCGHVFSGEPKPMPRWVIWIVALVALGLLIPFLLRVF